MWCAVDNENAIDYETGVVMSVSKCDYVIGWDDIHNIAIPHTKIDYEFLKHITDWYVKDEPDDTDYPWYGIYFGHGVVNGISMCNALALLCKVSLNNGKIALPIKSGGFLHVTFDDKVDVILAKVRFVKGY